MQSPQQQYQQQQPMYQQQQPMVQQTQYQQQTVRHAAPRKTWVPCQCECSCPCFVNVFCPCIGMKRANDKAKFKDGSTFVNLVALFLFVQYGVGSAVSGWQTKYQHEIEAGLIQNPTWVKICGYVYVACSLFFVISVAVWQMKLGQHLKLTNAVDCMQHVCLLFCFPCTIIANEKTADGVVGKPMSVKTNIVTTNTANYRATAPQMQQGAV